MVRTIPKRSKSRAGKKNNNKNKEEEIKEEIKESATYKFIPFLCILIEYGPLLLFLLEPPEMLLVAKASTQYMVFGYLYGILLRLQKQIVDNAWQIILLLGVLFLIVDKKDVVALKNGFFQEGFMSTVVVDRQTRQELIAEETFAQQQKRIVHERRRHSHYTVGESMSKTKSRLILFARLLSWIVQFQATINVSQYTFLNNQNLLKNQMEINQQIKNLHKDHELCQNKTKTCQEQQDKGLFWIFIDADIDSNDHLNLHEFTKLLNIDYINSRKPSFAYDTNNDERAAFFNAGGDRVGDQFVNFTEFNDWAKTEGFEQQLKSWYSKSTSRNHGFQK